MTNLELVAAIAGVLGQDAVYATDLTPRPVIADAWLPAESNHDNAINGVAYYVWNTLRGSDSTMAGVSYDDVRAIIVQQRSL
jgi:hypothetical protein